MGSLALWLLSVFSQWEAEAVDRRQEESGVLPPGYGITVASLLPEVTALQAPVF